VETGKTAPLGGILLPELTTFTSRAFAKRSSEWALKQREYCRVLSGGPAAEHHHAHQTVAEYYYALGRKSITQTRDIGK
jgi:hypothetical protein